MHYQPSLSAIPILQDPPIALWIVLLGTAIGRQALQALRAPTAGTSPWERGVLSSALGLGLLQWLPFALAASGALSRWTVGAGLFILSAVFARAMLRVLAAVARAAREQRALPAPWIRAGAVLLAIPVGLAFLQALCPPTDPDGVGYHLSAPKLWLQAGGFRYLPTLWHSNSPMGVEMLFTLAMAAGSVTAAKLIHYALGLVSLIAIFVLGRRAAGTAVGFAAAALWLRLLPQDYPLCFFTWANVDLGIVLEVAAAVLAWLLWRRSPARGWLVCSALCAGFAASFKLTALAVGPALALLVAADLVRAGAPAGRVVRAAAAFAGLVAAPLAPWLVKNAVLTGNPVYPLLSGIFPTRDWSPEVAGAFDTYFRYYAYDWYPGTVWSLATRQLARTAALIAVIGLGALVAWRCRSREMRLLAALTAILTLGGIVSTGLNIRFLVPVMPLALVLVLAGLRGPLERSGWIQGAILLALLVNGAYYVRKSFPGVRTAASTAVGLTAPGDYLARSTMIDAIWRRLNAEPAGTGAALVAALDATHGPVGGLQLYCDRPCYVTDAYLQGAIHIDDWHRFLGDVRARRVAYLVMANRVASPRVGPDCAAARNELPFAQRLRREYGRPLLTSGDFELDRLALSGAAVQGAAEARPPEPGRGARW